MQEMHIIRPGKAEPAVWIRHDAPPTWETSDLTVGLPSFPWSIFDKMADLDAFGRPNLPYHAG